MTPADRRRRDDRAAGPPGTTPNAGQGEAQPLCAPPRPTRGQATGRRRADDRGQITAVVAVLAVGLLALAGLVVDGGRALAAKSAAISLAAEAARAGAQQLDENAVRASGAVGLNPPAARARALAFLAANHAQGTATATTATVTVTVTARTATTALGLIGVGTLTETGTATVGLVTGPGPP
ncbi:hypothetical protein I6A60_29280 [Frankia sp. AgB1.9]|uniref:pilus assembly protein TadG-related protein n=1 Tax=unclassified Frankia TaxID=2632575 RepID=UPI0019344F8C|nr:MULTISPECIES: pilus assembly protein TadG-related protein [unclassified Frankia]MBL7489712.1 hypothetical protein [Frankia sp. AgW1.1]MBL7551922.1 hypothetical protein [Frankia sp. AgB1.9]MBL7623239.1 hypothetical protein [Frankia sp. AgB1.8]